MLAVERLTAIEKALSSSDCVSVSELSRTFNVTEETVRRDLDKIVSKDAAVVRVHGGAYRIKEAGYDAPYQLREAMLVEEKERIARCSFELIRPDDTVALDSSTTALHLAQRIKRASMRLTVITNSLRIAFELSDCSHTSLIVAGGTYRPSSRSFIGYAATKALEGLHADKAFVSCSGLDAEFGLTDNNEEEARIRRLMLVNANRRYLLVDSDKFGRCKNFKIAGLDGVHALFTDREPDEGIKALMSASGVELVVC